MITGRFRELSAGWEVARRESSPRRVDAGPTPQLRTHPRPGACQLTQPPQRLVRDRAAGWAGKAGPPYPHGAAVRRWCRPCPARQPAARPRGRSTQLPRRPPAHRPLTRQGGSSRTLLGPARTSNAATPAPRSATESNRASVSASQRQAPVRSTPAERQAGPTRHTRQRLPFFSDHCTVITHPNAPSRLEGPPLSPDGKGEPARAPSPAHHTPSGFWRRPASSLKPPLVSV